MSEPRPLADLASIEVTRLRHVGEKRAAALAELGVTSVLDLVTTYPRRYVDRTHRVDLSDLRIGDEVAIFGEVVTCRARTTGQGRAMVQTTVRDGDSTLAVTFFNQAWRAQQLSPGVQALFFGRVSEYRGEPQMTNPLVDVLVGLNGEERDPSRIGRIAPIYPTSSKSRLTSWEMGGFIEESLRRAGDIEDPLDEELRSRLGLLSRHEALHTIHEPESLEAVEAARRRLAFDELLRMQILVGLRRERYRRDHLGVSHPVHPEDLTATSRRDSLVAQFVAHYPYQLTGAQVRVLGEIMNDMSSPAPMHRLLQGDVGAGKTAVALITLLVAVDGGHQGAFMAPTEVLAEQHLVSLRRDVAHLRVADGHGGRRPLRVELLSGRLRPKEREQIATAIARGEVDIVVGTHALISEATTFASLGVVVIDEQHRFGVDQRAALRDKAHDVHADVLVMTATPIPRTAAMVIFGDLELSIIDEAPVGRADIVTQWCGDEEEAWVRVRAEVAAGHRAYVVCPLVEESERVTAANVTDERTRLAMGPLRGCAVGLLHGQMSSAEKEAVMEEFRRGEISVLVATVVIEVGIDVPEATVIVVQDAWRFGLAQLHQLRGRVGRSHRPSWCFLLGEAPSSTARQRLEALVATRDGFALAEIDLELRGAGTIMGARQRGLSDFKVARLSSDGDLVVASRDVADELVRRGEAVAFEREVSALIEADEADYLFSS